MLLFLLYSLIVLTTMSLSISLPCHQCTSYHHTTAMHHSIKECLPTKKATNQTRPRRAQSFFSPTFWFTCEDHCSYTSGLLSMNIGSY